jgi:hypothetical protein
MVELAGTTVPLPIPRREARQATTLRRPHPRRSAPAQRREMLVEVGILDHADVGRYVQELALSGDWSVRLPTVGVSDTDLLWLVAFLREVARWQLPVTWEIAVLDDVRAEDLMHLACPARCPEGTTAATFARWAHDDPYGRLYWRMGPDFVEIRDRRPFRLKPVKVVIGGSSFMEARSLLQGSVVADAITPLVMRLTEARMVMVVDGAAVPLPYRINGWPVPAYEV